MSSNSLCVILKTEIFLIFDRFMEILFRYQITIFKFLSSQLKVRDERLGQASDLQKFLQNLDHFQQWLTRTETAIASEDIPTELTEAETPPQRTRSTQGRDRRICGRVFADEGVRSEGRRGAGRHSIYVPAWGEWKITKCMLGYIFPPNGMMGYIFLLNGMLDYIFPLNDMLGYIFPMLGYIFPPNGMLGYIFPPNGMLGYIFTPNGMLGYIFSLNGMLGYISSK